VTEFDLRAVGWVVTRDTFVDIVLSVLGSRRTIATDLLVGLAEQWSALQHARAEERSARRLARADFLAASLSSRTANGLDAFLSRIVAAYPTRYAPSALRRRLRISLAQTGVGLAGGVLLIHAGLGPDSIAADAALVLLAMGTWCLVTSVQLWRTYQLVRRIVPLD